MYGSISCYVCSGFANECDNFLSAERVEECAALGFEGCVEQTYFTSKEPGDKFHYATKKLSLVNSFVPPYIAKKKIFRYCYNPKQGGFYHDAVAAVTYQNKVKTNISQVYKYQELRNKMEKIN